MVLCVIVKKNTCILINVYLYTHLLILIYLPKYIHTCIHVYTYIYRYIHMKFQMHKRIFKFDYCTRIYFNSIRLIAFC